MSRGSGRIFPNGLGRTTFLPDGSAAAVASGGQLLFLDTGDFELSHSLDIPASGSLAFSADGRLAYAPATGQDRLYVLSAAAAVPEPSSLGLVVLGALGVTGSIRWRRRRHRPRSLVDPNAPHPPGRPQGRPNLSNPA